MDSTLYFQRLPKQYDLRNVQIRYVGASAVYSIRKTLNWDGRSLAGRLFFSYKKVHVTKLLPSILPRTKAKQILQKCTAKFVMKRDCPAREIWRKGNLIRDYDVGGIICSARAVCVDSGILIT